MKNPLVPGGYKGWDWTSDEAHGALRARRDLSDRHLTHPPIVVARERAQRQPRRPRVGGPVQAIRRLMSAPLRRPAGLAISSSVKNPEVPDF
jgi:hypothetical protein